MAGTGPGPRRFSGRFDLARAPARSNGTLRKQALERQTLELLGAVVCETLVLFVVLVERSPSGFERQPVVLCEAAASTEFAVEACAELRIKASASFVLQRSPSFEDRVSCDAIQPSKGAEYVWQQRGRIITSRLEHDAQHAPRHLQDARPSYVRRAPERFGSDASERGGLWGPREVVGWSFEPAEHVGPRRDAQVVGAVGVRAWHER